MEELPRIRVAQEYELDVLLKDGSTVHLRPIKPEDEDLLIAFIGRLSPRTIFLRFHHVIKELTRTEAQRYTNVDYKDTYALVAIVGEAHNERIIAVGRYARLANSDRAEVAFVVEDTHQGRGISTHLLHQIAMVAKSFGIRVFEAEVLSENTLMMDVFRDSGFPLLTGWRGADPGDLEALKDLLLRVSAMVEDLPEISEMDFNPVKVLPPGQGCVVVDTRILLRQP